MGFIVVVRYVSELSFSNDNEGTIERENPALNKIKSPIL